MKKIFLIVGRSSSGKTSITREACKQLGLRVVKSYTTRPPRPKELNGESDHYFISPEEVDKYKDEICAYTEINGNQYFATKSELDACDAYVIDPRGIDYLLEKHSNEYDFKIVYVRTSEKIAKERAKQRGDNMDIFDARLKDENEQFKDFEHRMPWDYHLLNIDSFERAVGTMCKFMTKEFGL